MEHLAKEIAAGLKNLDDKPEVKDVLLANGYSDADFEKIRTLGVVAADYYLFKEGNEDKAKSLSETIKVRRNTLSKQFTDNARTLKDAYDNDNGILAKLGLLKPRPQRFGAFKAHAKNFYTSALDESVIGDLTGFGVNAVKIQAQLDLIAEIETMEKEYLVLRGEKEKSTAQRNRVYRELRKLWSSFERSCRLLFVDTPEVLEGIIAVPSEGFFHRRKKKTDPASSDGAGDDAPVTDDAGGDAGGDNADDGEPAEPDA